MINNELMPNQILTGEHSYAMALDCVIGKANNDLYIFDQDFRKGDYASLKRYEIIHTFLQKGEHVKLTIILQNTRFIMANCSRLMDLLRIYGHKMTVYQTNDFAKVAKDCFVIADKLYFCRRFHIDQSRFKYCNNGNDAETVSSLIMRFNELLGETNEILSATRLGL